MFFSGAPAEFADQQIAPGLYTGEAAIAQVAAAQSYAALLQWQHPGAVRTEARPTAAAEGEQGGVGVYGFFASVLAMRKSPSIIPAKPAVAWITTPLSRKRLRPGAQQRRGFHVGGKTRPELPTKVSMPSS